MTVQTVITTLKKLSAMKTTKNNHPLNQRSAEFRLPCLVALLLCAGVSARASLAADLQVNQSALVAQQSLNQSLQQLSTGLQINSAANNPSIANPYTWIQAEPNVLSLSYNPLDASQPQQILQLLQDASPLQTAVSTLAQANQSQQSVLQLFNGNNSQVSSVAQLSQVQSLQQASVQPQQVLKLIGQSDDAASLASLQQASADQSLSLVNQQLQTSVSSLQQANPVQSAVSLAQANQLNQLSTGLKINQAVDPAQLAVSTENGLVIQLNQNNDGYNNQLGLNAAGLSVNNQSLQALLDDPASQQTLQTSLTPNDFVTVGQLNQKQALAFFQMAQAISGQSVLKLFSDDSQNLAAPGVGDQFSTSVVALNNLNSPYLFISIVDQSGLDAQDYNSAVLAVNIGQANVHALLAAPEPSLYLTLGGFLALALWAKRRMDRLEAAQAK